MLICGVAGPQREGRPTPAYRGRGSGALRWLTGETTWGRPLRGILRLERGLLLRRRWGRRGRALLESRRHGRHLVLRGGRLLLGRRRGGARAWPPWPEINGPKILFPRPDVGRLLRRTNMLRGAFMAPGGAPTRSSCRRRWAISSSYLVSDASITMELDGDATHRMHCLPLNLLLLEAHRGSAPWRKLSREQAASPGPGDWTVTTVLARGARQRRGGSQPARPE